MGSEGQMKAYIWNPCAYFVQHLSAYFSCVYVCDFWITLAFVSFLVVSMGYRGSVYLTSPETSSWLSLRSYLIYNLAHGELRSRDATSQDWSPWTLFSLGLCGE